MKFCYGCDAPLSQENASEAHIIPNALGGRLAPKGIICRTCNGVLDRLADNALVEAFGDWPTMLDIPRQRGKNPPKIVDTREGHRVRVNANGTLTRIDVAYDVNEIPEGHRVTIGAGDMKTFRQLLKKAEKDFPHFKAAEAEKYAKVVGVESDDQLKMGLDFSPQAVFGGVLTGLWLFLILKTGRSLMDWDRLQSCIASMQEHGGIFRYLVDGLPGLNGPEIPLGHKIIVRSVPDTGELIAYMEILGVLKIGGVLAQSPLPAHEIEYIYAHDVLGKADRSAEFAIDAATFDAQDWRTVGLGPADADRLREHFKSALATFVDHYERRFA